MDKTAADRMKRYRNKKKELEVKKVAENEGTRLRMVRYRNNHKIPDVCEVCGHKGVTDIHHEGEAKDIHYLCPNCHAQLTRGKITLEELIAVTPIRNETQADVTVPPAIIRAITDPKVRSKLERISQGLNDRGLGKDVRYGIGGPTFDIVKELLEVTR